jgi:hypothetical protein
VLDPQQVAQCSFHGHPKGLTDRYFIVASNHQVGAGPGQAGALPSTWMAQPIHTYGLDAIPAEVIVERGRVRVVERQTRRTLHEVKGEPSSCAPASVQSGGPNLVLREPAPKTMTTRWVYLSCPLSLI